MGKQQLLFCFNYFGKTNSVYNRRNSDVTMFKSRCPLTRGQKRRSLDSVDRDDVVTWGYYITVSNNGLTFSEENAMVVFNSTCLTCVSTGLTVSC